MSANHNWVGTVAVKFLCTRSSHTGCPGFLPRRFLVFTIADMIPASWAEQPRGLICHREVCLAGFISEESIPKLRVISVSLTQGSDASPSQPFCFTGWFPQPPVIRNPGKLQNPTHHHNGNPVPDGITYEWIKPFPGILPCDTYARARRNTSASCSNTLMRLFASRTSVDSPEVIPGLTPSSTSAFLSQVQNVIG